MPLKLPIASKLTITKAINVLYGKSDGKAEVIAAVPAQILTATVNT